jgi:hypothetical protein
MPTVGRACEGCGVAISADDVDGFVDANVRHVLEAHADWGYTDRAVRAYVRRWFAPDSAADGREA